MQNIAAVAAAGQPNRPPQARSPRGDLVHLRELIEAGKLRTYIDRTYPMDEIVEAHRYVDQALKRGNVVITVDHGDGV